MSDEHEVWGWNVFFQEVLGTLNSIMREYGTANESYSHYAIDRMALCVQAVSQEREHLQQATEGDNAERVVVMQYVQDLSDLVSLICELVGY